MKKQRLLLVAVFAALALTFSACSSDDDKGGGGSVCNEQAPVGKWEGTKNVMSGYTLTDATGKTLTIAADGKFTYADGTETYTGTYAPDPDKSQSYVLTYEGDDPGYDYKTFFVNSCFDYSDSHIIKFGNEELYEYKK